MYICTVLKVKNMDTAEKNLPCILTNEVSNL